MRTSPKHATLVTRLRTIRRLSAEAKAARRARPNHPWCDDNKAPCRHCAAIRDIHACIDDHLLQLDEGHGDTVALAILFATPADSSRITGALCSDCGRSRFANDAGAIVCFACDGRVEGWSWYSLEGETTE